VLILASGNVVHNLRRIDWNQRDGAFDWNRRFDEETRLLLHDDPGEVLRLGEHPDFERAVPTPDHFIPLLYIAALAADAGMPATRFVDGYAYGSLSMACYGVDLGDTPAKTPTGGASAALPPPDTVPAEHTNL
jgi:4,5-DOPA dioxygenase extradiol